MLSVGDEAPTFTLPGTTAEQSTGAIATHSLDDALHSGPALVNFYVFDFHPACTEHMCALHDLSWFGVDDALTVFGVSTDRSFSHRAFADAEHLGFPLLSDSDGTVAEAYGVLYDEFEGHKRIAKRAVFLVDTDRTVRYAWHTDDPTVQPDLSTIKVAVDRLLASQSSP